MVQLPALNTLQFVLARNRLPRQPQPVPPIYRPEVAADAIVWAASHPRREVLVGGPTVVAVAGAKLAPGVGDLYLARTAYDAQQTDLPADPSRPDNRFAVVSGDHDAHGIFDDGAKSRSFQFVLNRYRDWIVSAAAVGAMLAGRRS